MLVGVARPGANLGSVWRAVDGAAARFAPVLASLLTSPAPSSPHPKKSTLQQCALVLLCCARTIVYLCGVAVSSKLPSVLSATDEEIQLLLAAQCHLGTKNCEKHMEPYVFKRRPDGA